MKFIRNVFSLIVLSVLIYSCEEDRNLDFVNNTSEPTNLSLTAEITQDNTGLVTLIPFGEGVSYYTIDLGDNSELVTDIEPGATVNHIFEEGVYQSTLTAFNVNGKSASINQELVVSFNAPENLDVTIENDPGISKQVNITVTADFAMSYEVNYGDGSELVSSNIGETISYIYQDVGVYTISIEVMGGAIETTTYTEDFEVTAIVQPLASAPNPPARADEDVISIFSAAYNDVPNTNYFPDWGQGGQGSSWALFDLNGDEILQYTNISYQGIALEDGTTIDVSNMEFLHLDVWTADVVTDLEVSLINDPSNSTEAPVTVPLTSNSWTSIEIPISDYIDQGLSVDEIYQLKFVGEPWAAGTVFIDNIYFYKSPSTPPTILGTWRVAPIAGSLGVGPSPGSTEWFAIDQAGVTQRACFYDDTYVFGTDGTFMNVLGADTWIEGWQSGATDTCGAPVAPHDGSNPATFSFNEATSQVTINGVGSYLGIPKATNTGEISSPADAPASITYDITLDDINNMTVLIEAGAGVYWTYKMERVGDVPTSPIVGSWKVAPEAGSLGVGPTPGSTEWFAIDEAGVTQRACFYDDEFVFGADGSFSNVLGTETWIEGWQSGVADACGSPVAPHDGSANATYVYDEGAGTITINGIGAYLGIPKATNTGEISSPGDAPSSITYQITFIDDNTINLLIEAGSGVFWSFKLIKN
jgi:hypothetical protein